MITPNKALISKHGDYLSKLAEKNNTHKGIARTFKFSGMLKCECGSSMYGEIKKSKYITYGCGARIHSKKCDSKPKYVSERILLKELEGILDKLHIDKPMFDLIHEQIKICNKTFELENEIQILEITKAITKHRSKLNRLFDHYDDGILTKDEYLEKKEYHKKELVKCQSKYETLNISPVEGKTKFMEFLNVFLNIDKFLIHIKNPTTFQKIMSELFEKITHENGNVKFHLNTFAKAILKGNQERNKQNDSPNQSTLLYWQSVYKDFILAMLYLLHSIYIFLISLCFIYDSLAIIIVFFKLSL